MIQSRYARATEVCLSATLVMAQVSETAHVRKFSRHVRPTKYVYFYIFWLPNWFEFDIAFSHSNINTYTL